MPRKNDIALERLVWSVFITPIDKSNLEKKSKFSRKKETISNFLLPWIATPEQTPGC